MILAQRPGVPREGIGERGSNSFFAQKFEKFICLNQTCFFNVECCLLTLSLPSTVALGLNYERSFSWKLNHATSADRIGMYLILETNGMIGILHSLDQLATWSSVEILFSFLQMLPRLQVLNEGT